MASGPIGLVPAAMTMAARFEVQLFQKQTFELQIRIEFDHIPLLEQPHRGQFEPHMVVLEKGFQLVI